MARPLINRAWSRTISGPLLDLGGKSPLLQGMAPRLELIEGTSFNPAFAVVVNDPRTLLRLDLFVITDLDQGTDHMIEGVHIVIVQDDLPEGACFTHHLLQKQFLR